MSSGTTYSRTSGNGILPLTWQAIQARHAGQTIPPDERTSWDAATEDERKKFVMLAADERTRPPDYLQFDLDANPYLPGKYPAAVPESVGRPADGQLAPGFTAPEAAAALGISEDDLHRHLANFSGHVVVVKLLPGATIYRTVGLTASQTKRGGVTNQLLGAYWEPLSPSTYPSIEAWRQATAVKAEWNGDYGFVEVTLTKEVVVLSGQVGMQVVDATNRLVLPGGGQQYFIPNMLQQVPDLRQTFETEPFAKLIRQTQFRTPSP